MVLYASQSLPRSSVACAVRCDGLETALRRCGAEVSVWSHTASDDQIAMLLPFPSNRLPTLLRLTAELALAVELALRLLWLRSRDRDIVLVLSSPPFATCFFVAQACRALGLRFVFDARDVYPEVLFNHGVVSSRSLVGRLLSTWTAGIYRSALFVSTPSEAFASTIRRAVADPSRILVIRNGYDDSLYRGSQRTSGSRPFMCVYHGLLGRMHNVRLLIDVADRVAQLDPDIRFEIVGYGPKESLLTARKRPNVRFLGSKPFHEIPAFLGQADLGLAFIEDTDGTDGAFPVKVYEYLGAGLPCLVTPHSEAGRLVSDLGMGAAFENGEADAIARTIVELAHGSPKLTEWRAAVDRERHAFGRKSWSDAFANELQRLATAGK